MFPGTGRASKYSSQQVAFLMEPTDHETPHTLALQQLYMGKERDDQKAQRSYKESSYSPTYKQSGQDC